MNGDKHAITGVAAGVITSPAAAHVNVPLPVWIGATVAGSIIPDMDHPSASIAQMWGPLTRIPARYFTRFVGGHRGATHLNFKTRGGVILAAATVAAVAYALATYPLLRAAAWTFLTGVFLAACDRLLPGRLPHLANLAISIAVGYASWVYGWNIYIFIVTAPLMLGWAVHLLGDEIPNDSPRATLAVFGSYALITAWCAWPLIHPHIHHLIGELTR